jgi:hypothetical protein
VTTTDPVWLLVDGDRDWLEVFGGSDLLDAVKDSDRLELTEGTFWPELVVGDGRLDVDDDDDTAWLEKVGGPERDWSETDEDRVSLEIDDIGGWDWLARLDVERVRLWLVVDPVPGWLVETDTVPCWLEIGTDAIDPDLVSVDLASLVEPASVWLEVVRDPAWLETFQARVRLAKDRGWLSPDGSCAFASAPKTNNRALILKNRQPAGQKINAKEFEECKCNQNRLKGVQTYPIELWQQKKIGQCSRCLPGFHIVYPS